MALLLGLRLTIKVRRGRSIQQGRCSALLGLAQDGVDGADKGPHGLGLVCLVKDLGASDACILKKTALMSL